MKMTHNSSSLLCSTGPPEASTSSFEVVRVSARRPPRSKWPQYATAVGGNARGLWWRLSDLTGLTQKTRLSLWSDFLGFRRRVELAGRELASGVEAYGVLTSSIEVSVCSGQLNGEKESMLYGHCVSCARRIHLASCAPTQQTGLRLHSQAIHRPSHTGLPTRPH